MPETTEDKIILNWKKIHKRNQLKYCIVKKKGIRNMNEKTRCGVN